MTIHKKKVGRKSIGEKPMTSAERAERRREIKKQQGLKQFSVWLPAETVDTLNRFINDEHCSMDILPIALEESANAVTQLNTGIVKILEQCEDVESAKLYARWFIEKRTVFMREILNREYFLKELGEKEI